MTDEGILGDSHLHRKTQTISVEHGTADKLVPKRVGHPASRHSLGDHSLGIFRMTLAGKLFPVLKDLIEITADHISILGLSDIVHPLKPFTVNPVVRIYVDEILS